MKKFTKIMVRVLPIVLVGLLIVGNVFGIEVPSSAKGLGNEGIDKVNNAAKSIWGSVYLILQILSIAAVVLAGIRYMFASADGKADIKNQTIILVVGAILVFAATTVLSFITSTTQSLLN